MKFIFRFLRSSSLLVYVDKTQSNVCNVIFILPFHSLVGRDGCLLTFSEVFMLKLPNKRTKSCSSHLPYMQNVTEKSEHQEQNVFTSSSRQRKLLWLRVTKGTEKR